MPLIRSFAEPMDGLLEVFRHAKAIVVITAHLELCFCMALRCGFEIPLQGFGLVLGGAESLVVNVAEGVLGGEISQLSSLAEPLDAFGIVLLHVFPLETSAPKFSQGVDVSLLRRLLEGQQRLAPRLPDALRLLGRDAIKPAASGLVGIVLL